MTLITWPRIFFFDPVWHRAHLWFLVFNPHSTFLLISCRSKQGFVFHLIYVFVVDTRACFVFIFFLFFSRARRPYDILRPYARLFISSSYTSIRITVKCHSHRYPRLVGRAAWPCGDGTWTHNPAQSTARNCRCERPKPLGHPNLVVFIQGKEGGETSEYISFRWCHAYFRHEHWGDEVWTRY